MSQTKAQRRKQQKANQRQRHIRKQHNIQRNTTEKRYRLDIVLDGSWKIGVREWAHAWQVTDHKNQTEELRAKGDTIVHGRVVDMKIGKVVLEIPASTPKGTAPDKIRDGAKAEDFKVEVTPGVTPVEEVKPVEPLTGPGDAGNLGTGEAGETGPEEKRTGSKFLRILNGERQ